MTISLKQENNLTISEVKDIVSGLMGAPVVSAERFGKGLNSRVYRLEGRHSERYIAKFYFRHRLDQRDRLGVEFSGLSFLWKEGFRCIPRPIAVDHDRACALYEYIDGEKVDSQEITSHDIDTAVCFLKALKDLRHESKSDAFPPASEACFSVQAAVENIQFRMDRLLHSAERGEEYNALQGFLVNELGPFFETLTSWCKKRLTESNLSFDVDIEREERTLSPSDFGFHNALRDKNGRMFFIDFEYFGWDDPAKMISDFLLHPAMTLRRELKQRFAVCMVRSFKEYKQLTRRVEVVYPLFALKWCLIFLNEFVRDDLLRRGFAQEGSLDKLRVQRGQLSKARSMLSAVKEIYRHFPYSLSPRGN